MSASGKAGGIITEIPTDAPRSHTRNGARASHFIDWQISLSERLKWREGYSVELWERVLAWAESFTKELRKINADPEASWHPSRHVLLPRSRTEKNTPLSAQGRYAEILAAQSVEVTVVPDAVAFDKEEYWRASMIKTWSALPPRIKVPPQISLSPEEQEVLRARRAVAVAPYYNGRGLVSHEEFVTLYYPNSVAAVAAPLEESEGSYGEGSYGEGDHRELTGMTPLMTRRR